MKVIGVTGMPGSGKSVVARIAKGMGMHIIRMGDVVREEAEERGADVGKVAVKIRDEYGKFVVAERCIEKIRELESKNESIKISGTSVKNQNMYMIEGIRSPHEVHLFKKNFKDFKVIAIYSSPKTRFKRLKKRSRYDDSKEMTEFKKRDKRELGFGIGDVIAASDYMIVNEGSLWKYKKHIRSVLEK